MRALLALATLLAFAGCKNPETVPEVMRILREAKFQGDITVTTGGKLSAGARTTFFAGPDDSALAAHGTVNFNDPVVRPADPPSTAAVEDIVRRVLAEMTSVQNQQPGVTVTRVP